MKLQDFCSDIVDCAHKTAPVNESGQYYAVGTPAMRGHVINYSEARRIGEEAFEAWTSRLRPKFGDILLAREAPVGPVVRIPRAENVAPGQRTVLLRPDPSRVHSDFLYYYLRSPSCQSELQVKASGSTVPHLNVADVRALPMNGVPSMPEQRAIAEVLGALDDKIAANEHAVRASQDLMIALASGTAKRAPLGELAVQSTASVKPGEFEERVAHFSLPAFDAGAMPELSNGASIKSNKFRLTCAAVLMAKLNPRIPRIWDVPSLPDGMSLASTEFVVLEPIGIPSSALWASLAQPDVSVELSAKVAGTSGSHQRVRPAEMLDLAIGDVRVLPDYVTDSIASLGEACQQLRLESRTLEATRDALLPLLMSGKVRVRDVEKLVDEVL